MDIKAVKLDLIHWLTELQDPSVLEKLSFIKSSQENELAEGLKKLLDERINSYEENPGQTKDWDNVMKDIEEKYGL